MREKKQYTPSEALEILGNGLYEIRILSKYTNSMYTTDFSTVDAKIKKAQDGKSNVYFTLNELNPALHSRPQSERFLSDRKISTTSDNDILAYRWLLIDLDPKRPSDVSSSDEEKADALKLARRIYKMLRDNGVSENSIIVADSGNGYHLLLRVNFENTKENVELVKKFLGTLDFLFSEEMTQVDIKNFNPSRITKMYGTTAHKGMNTNDRPHRLSNLITVPESIVECDRSIIERISNMIPKEISEHTKVSQPNFKFDANAFVDDFVQKHGISIIKDTTSNGVRRMVLDCCPFDSNHKHDSMIGVADGKPFFSCFHNSCSGNHWREFRLLYEPNFEREQAEKREEYENRCKSPERIEHKKTAKLNIFDAVETWEKSNEPKSMTKKKATPLDETKDWYTLRDGLEALNCEDEVEQGFPTGFSNLDAHLENGILAKGTFTIVSGDNSSGKSTFVNQLVLNVVNQGHKAAVYSGELVIKRFTKWILRQACGTENMKISKKGNHYVPDDVADEITKWAEDKIFLYNNKKGQKVSSIIKKIIECIQNNNAELIVIDNLMSMETDELGKDFGVDKQIIQASIKIAQDYNVHIILIAHPRKTNGYLRKDDICGEKNIANLADNIFIVHRNNADFIRAYHEFKTGKKWYEGCKTGFEGYGNIIEICKNRDNGEAIDQKIPFYFDVESRRFLEEEGEKRNYGWYNPSTAMSREIKYADDLEF